MKKRITALLLCLVMALSLIPTTVWAASNSTVVLHPSVNNTVTGVKVKVGDTIDGHPITSISGYDITVDLGKYNVNNDTFRLPYATDIWEGVDDNKVDYISWAGSGSNKRSEGGSALLANGKNTAYYYFKGAPVLLTFTLNYDANGGTGAPASQTYKATSQYEKSHTFTISSQTPTREGYTFLGWSTNKNATAASYQPGGSIVVTGTTTLYAVWKENTPPTPDKPTAPGEGDLSGLIGDITVNCTNDKASHTPKSKGYALISGSYTTSEVEGDAENGYTYTVTINSQKYVEKFDAETKVAHTPKDDSATVTLKYTDGVWTVTSGTPVVFNVVCETEIVPPVGPTEDEVKNLLTQNIRVMDDTDLHMTKDYKLKNVANSFTVGEVTTKNGLFVCPVTIKFQPFVDQYSKDVGKTHTLIKDSQTETVVELVASYDKETATWKWTAAKADRYATIHVECEIPAAPTDDEIANLGKVRVICNTNDKHETKVYDLIPGTYTTIGISELTGKPVESEVIYDEDYEQFVFDIYILNKDEYGADSVDGIAPYVDKYNKEFGAHAVVDTFTMCTLAYNEESGAWELLKGMVLDPDTDEAVLDEYYGAARISVQCVNDPTAEDLKELGVTVDVDCKKAKHTAKDYDLTGDETLTVTKKEENGVWTATVSLSKDSAKAFLKLYSKDIGKSHTKLLTNGTIDLVFEDGVWTLADAEKNVLNITTNCSTSGGGTTTPDDGGKKVESGKTFDAGIAMYVGLSILSVTGGALVIGKKKEF